MRQTVKSTSNQYVKKFHLFTHSMWMCVSVCKLLFHSILFLLFHSFFSSFFCRILTSHKQMLCIRLLSCIWKIFTLDFLLSCQITIFTNCIWNVCITRLNAMRWMCCACVRYIMIYWHLIQDKKYKHNINIVISINIRESQIFTPANQIRIRFSRCVQLTRDSKTRIMNFWVWKSGFESWCLSLAIRCSEIIARHISIFRFWEEKKNKWNRKRGCSEQRGAFQICTLNGNSMEILRFWCEWFFYWNFLFYFPGNWIRTTTSY